MSYYRRGEHTSVKAGRALAGHLARRLISALSDTATRTTPQHTVTAPAAPVEEPTGLFTPDEMPAVEVIEAAAADYDRAGELARRADRGKRAARKVLDRLPAGLHGTWLIERVPNAREVADLEAIRAIFTAHGLGDVPMKPCAPSLKVSRAAQEHADERAAELLAA